MIEMRYAIRCHFPIGILCQVWGLIVSIPDLCPLFYYVKVERKLIQSSTIPDPEHQFGKLQNARKQGAQESQEFSPLPAGGHKAARNRQDRITD